MKRKKRITKSSRNTLETMAIQHGLVDLFVEAKDFQKELDTEKESNHREILSLIKQCENRLKFMEADSQKIFDLRRDVDRLKKSEFRVAQYHLPSFWKKLFGGRRDWKDL